ncbi:hypothetical protein A3D72_00405 [Candidatus Uhrbacteria bacterium RIFCSPHIGHO2_02_FULL_57_19]|uniref:Aspartyl/glutamyl-tRNA(Asn/Gln) amidotransferase subunit C n=1 Tax=Candidatus Uhrbacteria bacterium RIFCSPHIGHO2_02_FULL_57_19 TaxID=1802391 RepID=A0A1F7U867_9BACT|nr:MAG: hypothetical protein A3D72_00405 [Candidatus Uhrbacteria bacterium RIFCSPHIGHO2_02_FULL_57_19]
MKITEQQIEHLADLARIELTDVEKVKFGSQLSAILGYVNKLNQLDTEGVPATSQVTGLLNVWREDHIEGCEPAARELIVENFPDRQENLVKVKGVFKATPEEF